MQDYSTVKFKSKIEIYDDNTNELIHEGENTIHPQNVSRVIARALAREPNYYVKRIAFGNGGTFTDGTGEIIYNASNDGSDNGWESRLYNETYSEIVDEDDADFQTDPGSADAGNVRPGGGAIPADDPTGSGVVSEEASNKSTVITTVYINRNEPTGQLGFGETDSNNECFVFDEIGLYSPGLPATATSGYTNIDVGDKISESISNLSTSQTYDIEISVDGNTYNATIDTPASGTGTSGEITFGDLAEGINTGDWISSGDSINDYVYVYITDRTGGTYPTIVGKKSYGFLIFESKTTGSSSTVSVTCDENNNDEIFNILTNGNCGNCNVNPASGQNAGVINDPQNPNNERERLLSHFIFAPIIKERERAIRIVYKWTVVVVNGGCDINVSTTNN